MSGGNIDRLAEILGALYKDASPPFTDHTDLYATIDAIQQGDIPWESFSVAYNGPQPENGNVPTWMTEKYQVWFRNPLDIFEHQIGSRDFEGEMDFAPKRVFKNGKRQFTDFFSGNWAWQQAVSHHFLHILSLFKPATGQNCRGSADPRRNVRPGNSW